MYLIFIIFARMSIISVRELPGSINPWEVARRLGGAFGLAVCGRGLLLLVLRPRRLRILTGWTISGGFWAHKMNAAINPMAVVRMEVRSA